MKRNLLFVVLAITGLPLWMSSCQKAPELTLTSSSNIEFSADGSSGSITFTANRDWTARANDSWVSVSPSSGAASDGAVTVTVRCNANTTYEDRSTTVTINMGDLSQTVTVKQPANKGIVLPKQVFDLQSDTRSIDVEVQANVQYSVSSSVDWIKQTGTKALTSKTLTFSIEENKTYDSREGKITIKPNEGNVQEQVITVRQAQKDALIVEKTSYDMPYGGGEIEIKVEANVAFNVTPNVDWLHYIQTKALSSSTVCIKVDENSTYSNREGKIEIAQQNGSLKHTITVKQGGRIAVTSVTLDKTSVKLKEGESVTLVATVKPDNATDKTVTWTSSEAAVASADASGKVTAIKEGSATITAKAGEKSATCSVIVKNDVPVNSVELNRTTLSLIAGETASLVATVKPDEATDKTVTWSSSDSQIASVDNQGKITAVAKGHASIIAKAGDKTATCIVFIKAKDYSAPAGAVDLGLSVDWAEKNYGASLSSDIGGYYLWGDPAGTGKIGFFDTPDVNLTSGTQYDIAQKNLGRGWRLPLKAELEELFAFCTKEASSVNGVSGVKLTGPSGNSIFIPLSGMGIPKDGPAGSYSISSRDKGYLMSGESYKNSGSRFAWIYRFEQSGSAAWVSYNALYALFPIRPVYEMLEDYVPVTSVTLNKTSLSLQEGESETLVATVLPDNATDDTVTWSSSDASIATVDNNGKVTAIKDGIVAVTAKASDKKSICSVTVKKVTVPDGAVDLGVVITRADGSTYRLFWAECNLGANNPEEFGYYYAWGETEIKNEYNWSTYKWYNSENGRISKYCTKSDKWDGAGEPDAKTILDPEDDAAHVCLGGKWRIPTNEEWQALKNNTNRVWTESNGIYGYMLTSKINGNSIFLPASGSYNNNSLENTGIFGCYWSSSLSGTAGHPYRAWALYISKGTTNFSMTDPLRFPGYSIRPVTE